jgi:peptide/nickel transport system ATP-binding protein
MGARESILSIRGLNVSYAGATGMVGVLRDLDFDVLGNAITGIAGESGSGKTTLANTVLNILPLAANVESGSVTFQGKDLLKLDYGSLTSIRGRLISYVPQSAMNSLNPVRRIRDDFFDIMKAHGIDPNSNLSSVYETLELVDLDRSILGSYPHELSGGMRQRAIIAISLVLSPELIIVDEPTTGLDVIVQHDILKALQEARKAKSLSIIFITHDLPLLYQLADYIAILYGGVILEYATYEKLLNDADHPYSYLLLKSVPSLVKRTKKLVTIPGDPVSFRDYPNGCPFAPRCPFVRKMCSETLPPATYANSSAGENTFFYRCFRSPAWKNEIKSVES